MRGSVDLVNQASVRQSSSIVLRTGRRFSSFANGGGLSFMQAAGGMLAGLLGISPWFFWFGMVLVAPQPVAVHSCCME